MSAVDVVPKALASWLAEITFRTEEGNEMPAVADTNVERPFGVCFSLLPVASKAPAVGFAVLTFRTEGANGMPDVAEANVGIGAGGAAGPKEACPFELGREPAAGVCLSVFAVVAKVPPTLLSAILFGTKGAGGTPSVADANVEVGTGGAAEVTAAFSEDRDLPFILSAVDTDVALDELSVLGDI